MSDSSASRTENVFSGSRWIWYGTPCVTVVNAMMQARRRFTIERKPRKTLVRVTADARYRLYVNGAPVCRGPARGFQSSWPYDEVDIAPYLRKGKNVIAAQVHSLGISNFQYLHTGWAGFILAGKAGGTDLATGPEWKVRKAPGHRQVQARLSAQMGFQEFFDARQDDGRWVQLSFNDGDWLTPACFPSGQLPWPAHEPRGIPLMREWPEQPAGVISTSRFKPAAGALACEDVVKLYCSEERKWTTGRTPSLRKRGDWREFEVEAARSKKATSYCVDFGKEVTACVRLRARGAAGGEVIDVIGCECAPDGEPIIKDPDTLGDRVAVGSRVTLGNGTTTHELFAHWGFRYLVITVRNAGKSFDLGVGANCVGYPLGGNDAFVCSDEMLNRVYEVSHRTLQCCMLDAYVDCPWREQAQWFADARIHAAAAFGLTGEDHLFRRALKQIGTQADPDGLPFALTPAIGYNHIMLGYICQWIMGFEDHYERTSDTTLFGVMEPVIRNALDFFASRCRNPLGLLEFPREKRWWVYLTTSPLHPPKKGRPWHSTLLNLLYFGALRSAARLYGLTGNAPRARETQKEMNRLREALISACFDASGGAFFGGVDARGRPLEPFMVTTRKGLFDRDPIACAWAVLLDAVPDRNEDLLAPVLEMLQRPQPVAKIWMLLFVFEALKKEGRGGDVIDCIRRWWGDELKETGLTTTPEFWSVEEKDAGAGSVCHAWGAHPMAHFMHVLLGIWQAAPEMKRIRFRPEFCGLEWARGAVQTPLGEVHSEWRRSGESVEVKLAIPRGMSAKVELPGHRQTLRGPARRTFRLRGKAL